MIYSDCAIHCHVCDWLNARETHATRDHRCVRRQTEKCLSKLSISPFNIDAASVIPIDYAETTKKQIDEFRSDFQLRRTRRLEHRSEIRSCSSEHRVDQEKLSRMEQREDVPYPWRPFPSIQRSSLQLCSQCPSYNSHFSYSIS